MTAFQKGKQIDSIYTNFSKPFDEMNHSLWFPTVVQTHFIYTK